jgi:hypothetical protein
MMCNQLAKTVMLAKAHIHEPLHQVHVRSAIAFDDDRPVFGDCNIPPEHKPAFHDLMRSLRKRLHFAPEWQAFPLDWRAGRRVMAMPA